MRTDFKKMILHAPAKVNAFLQVTNRRSDGYHEIRTLFVPVSLYDIIEIEFRAGEINVVSTDSLAPSDETNLAARAARSFFDKTGISSGLDIKIEKNIPVAAGLGGGSSDAASVLKGLNSFFKEPLTLDELCSLALKIGADVPFFVHGRPSYAEGVGEILSPAGSLVPYELLIVNPGVPLSTAMVYKKLNLGLTKCKKENKYPALNQGPCDIKNILSNDLETPALELCPVIGEVKKTLSDLGSDGVLMSGSGPSVFGIFTDADRADWSAGKIKKNTKWWAHRVQMNLSSDGLPRLAFND